MCFSGADLENIAPCSLSISSPYDEEAHYGKKRSTTWVGFKGHFTETCEAHLPLIVTHVETTAAPVSDDAMTATIHAGLEHKELLPAEHIVDTGYVDAKLLVESQRDYQIDPGRAPQEKITTGKPVRKRATTLITFLSTGKNNRRCVRRGTPVVVGRGQLTRGKTKSSR